MSKPLIKHNLIVMEASTVGFFYDYGKRCNTCRHSSCGWKSLLQKHCSPLYYSAEGSSWYPSDKAQRQELAKHKKTGCQRDWCVVEHGQVPEGGPVELSVPCKKTYFKAYTPQQLADPTVKVELAAVELTVAEHGRCPRSSIVCVYDLMNDRWHNAKWWKTTPKGSLAPVDGYAEPEYAPKDIHGIEEVIAKVKATL